MVQDTNTTSGAADLPDALEALQLKSCPCGATPTALQITGDEQAKWAHVSGNCCGEWEIEYRNNYTKLASTEAMTLATAAWNEAPRASHGQAPASKIEGLTAAQESLGVEFEKVLHDNLFDLYEESAPHGQAPAQAEPAYKDCTPELHVGDSAFESWYSSYTPTHKSNKQRARDAYAAGMGEPLVTAAPAAVAGQSEFPHEKMDAVALGRYKAVSSDQSMFYSFAVVAGDGTQQLYIGREVDCQNMARKFAGAFLDGAFAYHSMTAAPTTQPGARQQSGVGISGFDHKTAADFLTGKTISDEAMRKFVAASRWAHDDRTGLQATLLSVRNELAAREAEIALLKTALMKAEAAAKQGGAA